MERNAKDEEFRALFPEFLSAEQPHTKEAATADVEEEPSSAAGSTIITPAHEGSSPPQAGAASQAEPSQEPQQEMVSVTDENRRDVPLLSADERQEGQDNEESVNVMESAEVD